MTVTLPTDVATVIPLFNKRPYIGLTLNSVLSQSVPPREVIVIDDGSTDGGPEYVLEEFPEVTVIIQENAGVGAARNTGLLATSCSWVAFMDADDIWSPTHLSEVQRLISECPEARLVGTAHVQSFTQAFPQDASFMGTRRCFARYFKLASRDIGVIWTSAAAVHRRTALSVGGFGDFSLGQDLEFWARLALLHPVATSSAVTAVHVRGTGGAMDTGLAGGSRQRVVPRDIRDLSPSCQTVFEALSGKKHLVDSRDLIAYIDSRVAAAMSGRLARGDSVGARDLRELMLRRWHPRWWVLQLLASAPRPMLRSALGARSALLRRKRPSPPPR